jgi:sugar phosphate permease
MTDNAKTKVPNSHRWVIFSIICLIYFFVYFHRVSTSVIAADILKAFDTNATALGFMSSMYFYLYALEQPFVGYFTDKLGARRVMAYSTMVAAAGCFLFALAPGIGWASAGRALIGIGVGGVYVPAIKAFSQWFRNNEFATMLGLLAVVGNLGAIIATTPLAWAASEWGWRGSFNFIGVVSLVLALAALFLMKDFPQPGKNIREGSSFPVAKDDFISIPFYQHLASRQFWILAVTFFGVYGITITFQGLWATPFLMAALATDQITASKLNMIIPAGFIVGSPLFGLLADRVFQSKVQAINILLGMLTISWAGIVFGMNLGIPGIIFFLFLMGIAAGGFINLLWAQVKEITPFPVLGTYSGLLNVAPFLGVALFQVLTGSLLGRASLVNGAYLPAAYESSFAFCFMVSCACLVLSFFIKKQKPKTV